MTEHLRVLLVEDSEADAELVLAELRRAGWAAECRRVQTEAELAAALGEGWDVALLDARLPRLDAATALATIGELAPDLPALVVTGTMHEEEAAQVMRAGARDFVTKARLSRLGPAIRRELAQVDDRRAARRQEQQRAELAAIVGSSDDAIIGKDLGGIVRTWNAGAVRMYGYTAEEMVGRSIAVIFPPTEADALPALLTRIAAGERICDLRVERRRRDGSPVNVSLTLSPVHDAAGGVVGAAAIARDLTAQQRAEEALRASEARYRLIVDAALEGILFVDAVDRVSFANRAFAEMLGYTRDELVGRPALELVAPDYAERARANLELRRRGYREAAFEFCYRHRDGHRVDAVVSASDVRDEEGNYSGTLTMVADATDRKRAEAALAANERQLRLLVRQMPAILWTIDAQGVLTSVDGAGMAGRRAEMFLGKTIGELGDDPAGRERQVEGHRRALAGESVSYTTRWQGRVWDVHTEPLRDGDGAIVGAIGVSMDVSELKEAQETLRRSEERFRRLAENAQDIVYRRRCDPERSYEYVSPAVEAITGYSPAEVYADPGVIQRGIDADDRDRVLGADHVAAEGPLTFRFRRKDGRVVWLERRQRIVEGADGTPVLEGIVCDVTHRIEADEALRESEEKFRAVFEGSFDAMAIIDNDRRFLDVNRAGVALYGLPAPELIGRTVDEFDAAPPDDFEARWRRLFEDGVLIGEKTLVRHDGELRQVEIHVSVDIRPGRHLGVLRDVTERRRLERQLQATERMEAVGRLAGGVAHDFNNVLLVVKGFATLLQTELEGQSAAEDAAQIVRAADRAAGLVRQLLAFSRRQVLQPVALDVNDVVRDSENFLRRLLGEDVRLELVLEDELAAVEADAGQIEQLLVNLAANARDAMPDGGLVALETQTVVLELPPADAQPALEPGRYVAITVADTGVGIDADTQGRIFEPFFTTKGEGGTGLGLATVYGIVTQSGGAIRVESEPGRGTRFTVYLPVTDAVAARADEPPAADADSRRAAGRVLVVEDEQPARDLVLRVLRDAGYAATAAAQADEALVLARTGEFDVVVTDVVMPGMSGRALADELRVAAPRLRVIFMSGYSDSILEQKGAAGAGIVFLQKPFTPPDLIRTVDRVLAEAT